MRIEAFASCAALFIAGLLAAPAANADQPLLMTFRDKPPYSYVDYGVQKGFLLERVRQILAAAKVEAVFRDLPPKRIFADLAANAAPQCSFGWYRMPERERFARFSLPIHRDRPHVILAGPRALDAIRQHKTLRSLMADNSLVLGVVDGVSYGPELDTMIAEFRGPLERSLIPPLQLARKVANRRVDFMFIDQEDLDYLLQTSPALRDDDLTRLSFPDLPPGLKRYILCNQSVGSDIMARIDQAIARVVK